MSTDYKFQGWMGLGPDADKGTMVWQEFTPKPFEETDVDIKITHCGICGSDIHTLRSGWAPTNYPCCVGHEIVGEAVKVGSQVKHVKIGDRVGVGAQSGSCEKSDCEYCTINEQNYCPRMVGTYNSKYPDGSKSYGGYSDYARVPGTFVIKVPDGISSAEASVMMCGGVTIWNPLVKNGAGPGKKVGIVGIGGIGMFGLLWAKALGCDEVVAISRSSAKKADAEKMGATKFIATGEDKDWAKNNFASLDLLVSTVSGPEMPISEYLQLLRVHGDFIQIGVPEDPIPSFGAFALIGRNVRVSGSLIGSPADIAGMLEFAAKNNVHPWIEERPLSEANKAIVDMEQGKAKYRYVLVNEKHTQ